MGPTAVTRSRENVAVTFLALLALTAVVTGAALAGPPGLIASPARCGPRRLRRCSPGRVWGIMVRWAIP